MSDNLAAAAKALEAPEAIVKRSAEARAKATGMSVEDVLAAWAGGVAPEVPAPATPTQQAASLQEVAQAPPPPATAAAPPAPAAPPPLPAVPVAAPTAGPAPPPILEGRPDNPLGLLAAAVALFLMGTLLGFFVPILPVDAGEARTSAIAFSETALEGRAIYGREGCGACHTQQVRPVVPDVGLGPVTLADSNQVLGAARIGPDLAHVGSRADPVVLRTFLLSLTSRHPYYGGLPPAELEALIAYLAESK